MSPMDTAFLSYTAYAAKTVFGSLGVCLFYLSFHATKPNVAVGAIMLLGIATVLQLFLPEK